ncbi:glucuronate isomerase [Roseibacillus ishigakijimensis]|uniref:Uronate isomerase n=1 Tax=Roseibacillus ishigakijimensis TaxID=454146 RepID=A0A934VMJ1_9BACT|nr:glucuronate isomerase [Roseibacillus ishigakijimensis]MBK1834005.1 glucuronate isomerase [Roseibacillus ishigakijimensis]
MANYLDDDFLLSNETARHLYHEVAAKEPILDYHTHLPPAEIHHNHRWSNLTEIWLKHDHYKWRAMRANGIPESHITGSASDREKFDAWAATVPHTLRNPLYDWTHLELKRAFGIDLLLSPETADEVWEQANERLAAADFSAQGLLEKFDVAAVGTTDDPTDGLDHHGAHNASDHRTKIYPTFRPDKALAVDRPDFFSAWVQSFGELMGKEVAHVQDLLPLLEQRHGEFHEANCRLSDHGLSALHGQPCSLNEAERIFQNSLAGVAASPEEQAAFAALIMQNAGRWNAKRNWTMQLHLNPHRNPNSRRFAELGPDSGFDTIGDVSQGGILEFLDLLDQREELPKTILYTLNPRENPFFAAATGSFCEAPTPGKIQFGAAWWFNDTKQGILAHLDALSSLGLLSHFVGFLTDSRSFLSYPRHEYFRRILCNLIGSEAEAGEIPSDLSLLEPLIQGLSYTNCAKYLNLPQP